MANINFQKIIDDLSYHQENFSSEPLFFLKQQEKIIVNDGSQTDADIINYISKTDNFDIEERESLIFVLNQADRDFDKTITAINKAIQAPATFVYEYITNKNSQVSSLIEANAGNQKINFVTFNKKLEVRIVENGLGKNLSWCKVIFNLQTQTGNIIKSGFCRRKDLEKNPNNNSEIKLISEQDFSRPLLQTNKKVFASDTFLNEAITKNNLNKVEFSELIASYYTVFEVEISSFNGLLEQQVKKSFKEAYSKCIKFILKSINRRQTTADDKNLEDTYLCFSKIQTYQIGFRRLDNPLILVSIPKRNIDAVVEVENPLLFLGESVQIANAILEENSFDFTQIAPNISNALQSFPSPYSGERIDLFSVDANKEYISPSEILQVENRTVKIPAKFEKLKNFFDQLKKIIKIYSKKLEEELKKNDKTEVFIELNNYLDSLEVFYYNLITLKANNSEETLSANEENNFFVLVFDKYSITEILFLKDGKTIIPLQNTSSIINNEPATDNTFSFLICNASSLIVENQDLSISDFLSKYIFPEERSQIKYEENSFQKSLREEIDCLKNYKQQAIIDLKNSTNEFINNIISQESIKNFQDSINEEEWRKVLNNIDLITEQQFGGSDSAFFDLKTINWDLIIEEITKCITDNETRQNVIAVLNVLKNKLIFGTPITCQLPPPPQLRFPLIKFPTIPHPQSIVSSFYQSFTDTIIQLRSDVIVVFIKSINDFALKCSNNVDPSDIGKEKAKDLLDDFQVATSNALESSGIPVENGEKEILVNEIKIVLDNVAENLTKNEMLTLFVGSPSKETLQIVKKQINLLELSGKIEILPIKLGVLKPKIFSSSTSNDPLETVNSERKEDVIARSENNTIILSDKKVIFLFKKFDKSIKTDILNDYLNRNNITNNPNLLCLDTTVLNENIKKALSDKGLSERDALIEISRKDDEIKKAITQLSNALSLMDQEFVKQPNISCVKNPDGSITPGISDRVGIPEAFKISSDNLVEDLYSNFDISYNNEVPKWFLNSTQKKSEFSLTAGDNRVKNVFIETVQNQLQKSSSLLSSLGTDNKNNNFIAKLPTYYYSNDLNEKKINNPITILTNFYSISNQISYEINIKYLQDENFISGVIVDNNFSSSYSGTIFGIPAIDDELTKNKNIFYKTPEYSNLFEKINLKTDNYDFLKTQEEYYSKNINHKRLVEKLFKNSFSGSYAFQTDVSGSSKLLAYNLNPLLTKKQKKLLKDNKCDIKDKRLINLEDVKKNILSVSNQNSCVLPEIDDNGIKSPSVVDNTNFSAILSLLMRIYAIDFNFKLLPLSHYLGTLNSNSLYSVFYALFFKDLEKIIGSIFVKKIKKQLVINFLKLEDEAQVEESILDEKIMLNVFKLAFEPNFKEVNTGVLSLIRDGINSTNNFLTGKTFFFSPEEQILFDKKYKTYLDFIFDNVKTIKFGIGSEVEIPQSNQGSVARQGFVQSTLANTSTTEQELKFTINNIAITQQEAEQIPFCFIKDDNKLIFKILNNGFFKADTIPATFVETKSTNLYTTEYSESYNYKEDKQFKELFYAFFSSSIPLEEIFVSQIAALLLSMSSIEKITSSFDGSKRALKSVYDIIESANDYKKPLENDGLEEAMARLSILFKTPEFIIKGLAETTDPNVAISSNISKAYEAAVLLSEMAGVQIPVKKLPLFAISPLVSATGIPPLTPQGFISIALSLKDISIDLEQSIAKEDDVDC